jgi:hypothetical protein
MGCTLVATLAYYAQDTNNEILNDLLAVNRATCPKTSARSTVHVTSVQLATRHNNIESNTHRMSSLQGYKLNE